MSRWLDPGCNQRPQTLRIRCPNCGGIAYRQRLQISARDRLNCPDTEVLKTECPSCDYFLRMGGESGQVLEAYIPCGSAPTAPKSFKKAANMKTILVIDDNPGILNALKDWLTLEGFHPLTARNGAAGLSLMAYHRPDLVLCDFRMPIMDGLETLRALRHDPYLHHIPFVIMAAEQGFDRLLADAQLDVNGLLKKPVSVLDLSHTLKAIA
jgi:CheY-like chemotaxis protein